jgi:hypothetical protein
LAAALMLLAGLVRLVLPALLRIALLRIVLLLLVTLRILLFVGHFDVLRADRKASRPDTRITRNSFGGSWAPLQTFSTKDWKISSKCRLSPPRDMHGIAHNKGSGRPLPLLAPLLRL